MSVDGRGLGWPSSTFESTLGCEQGFDHVIANDDESCHGPKADRKRFIAREFPFRCTHSLPRSFLISYAACRDVYAASGKPPRLWAFLATSPAVNPVGEVDNDTIARMVRRMRERFRSTPPTLVLLTMLGAGSSSSIWSAIKQASTQCKALRKRPITSFVHATVLGKFSNLRRNGVSEALCTITSMRRTFSPWLRLCRAVVRRYDAPSAKNDPRGAGRWCCEHSPDHS